MRSLVHKRCLGALLAIMGGLREMAEVPAKLMKGGSTKLPVVSVFGHHGFPLFTPFEAEYEEKRLDCRFYPSEANLDQVLTKDRPDVIITLGDRSFFRKMSQTPLEIRKRWIHYDSLPDLAQLGIQAYDRHLQNVFDVQGNDAPPLVTVFTAAYRCGERIERPFRSLREQSYTNWEWVIVDDSDDDGRTFHQLRELARKDHRIQVFKPAEHSGVIGKIKNWACGCGRGSILVELDHDDALTDYALGCVVEGFRQFPEAGFVYTDCAEIFEDGTSYMYRDGWAFGYGSYADVEYKGRRYKAANACNINAKTIRHIISSPNHIRAWRKAFYESIGGHNRELHVADDYEILVRTFLKTRMVRVPKLCYLQYIGHTAQESRNGDIHRHVRSIRTHYDRMIHERLLELGCEDFAWVEAKGCSDYMLPNPGIESHATLTAKV